MKQLLSIIQPFLVALQFLTIIPVRLPETAYVNTRHYSLACYPLVSLLLGMMLAGCAWLGRDVDTELMALVLLLLWVTVTGGLHLDGLADAADAWIGGHGDCERTLMIMKDASCGPMAVTAIVMLLLFKYVTLNLLLEKNAWLLIFMIPVFARTGIMAVILHVPYVRSDGLGRSLASDSAPGVTWSAIGIVLLLLIYLDLSAALIGLAITIITALIIVVLAKRRLGGMTGDIYGALIEITEVALLSGFILAVIYTNSYFI